MALSIKKHKPSTKKTLAGNCGQFRTKRGYKQDKLHGFLDLSAALKTNATKGKDITLTISEKQLATIVQRNEDKTYPSYPAGAATQALIGGTIR